MSRKQSLYARRNDFQAYDTVAIKMMKKGIKYNRELLKPMIVICGITLTATKAGLALCALAGTVVGAVAVHFSIAYIHEFYWDPWVRVCRARREMERRKQA